MCVCVFDERKMFTRQKWFRFWFLWERTIAHKMVSSLSPCKQSLSFSQSLCECFSFIWHYSLSDLFWLFFRKSIRSNCTNIYVSKFVFHRNLSVTRHSSTIHTIVPLFFFILFCFFFIPVVVFFTLKSSFKSMCV